MAELWLPALAVVSGITLLVWSADRFVAGSAALAGNFGVSKLVIGLTLVSLGTSAPEILVSINATLSDAGDLAVGNALGSNLANLGLVLALTCLVSAIPFQAGLLRQELPALLLITALAGVFMADDYFAPWEGGVLLGLIPVLLYFIARLKGSGAVEIDETDLPKMANRPALFWFCVGLLLLIGSARLLVWGAQELALGLGVSPLVIGLTVVAVGTSLPELAASLMSALRGHHDIALGNVVGSNIFNILAVMSIPALGGGLALAPEVLRRDYFAVAALTAFLAIAMSIAYWRRGGRAEKSEQSRGRLGRGVGALLLGSYFAYYWLLFG